MRVCLGAWWHCRFAQSVLVCCSVVTRDGLSEEVRRGSSWQALTGCEVVWSFADTGGVCAVVDGIFLLWPVCGIFAGALGGSRGLHSLECWGLLLRMLLGVRWAPFFARSVVPRLCGLAGQGSLAGMLLLFFRGRPQPCSLFGRLMFCGGLCVCAFVSCRWSHCFACLHAQWMCASCFYCLLCYVVYVLALHCFSASLLAVIGVRFCLLSERRAFG